MKTIIYKLLIFLLVIATTFPSCKEEESIKTEICGNSIDDDGDGFTDCDDLDCENSDNCIVEICGNSIDDDGDGFTDCDDIDCELVCP